VPPRECTAHREKVTYVKLHGYNQKDLNAKWDVYRDKGERNFKELEMLTLY
jgi:hypothetical protein